MRSEKIRGSSVSMGNSSRFGQRVWHFLFLALLVAFGCLAAFSWPVADDFCNIPVIRQHGALGYVNYLYFHWSGRVLSTFMLSLIGNSLPLFQWRWASVVFAIAFILTLLMIVKQVARADSRNDWRAMTVLGLSVFLFQFRHDTTIGETVIWGTGGAVYAMVCFLAVFLLVSFFKWRESGRSGCLPAVWYVGLVLLAIVVGTGLETLTPALLTVLILDAGYRRYRRSGSWTADLGVIAACLLGGVILYVAPGNFVRSHYGEHSFSVHLYSYPFRLLELCFSFARSSWRLFLGSVFIGKCIYWIRIFIRKCRLSQLERCGCPLLGLVGKLGSPCFCS